MQFDRNTVALIIVGAFALLAQKILAPAMSFGDVVPNFILAFCLALAVAQPQRHIIAVAFVMGLLYNLYAQGPIGTMAFCLVVAAYCARMLFTQFDNDNPTMPLVAVAVLVFCVNAVYGGFMVAFLDGVGIGQALLHRVIPCSVYDIILTCLMYFLLKALTGSEAVKDYPGHIRYR